MNTINDIIKFNEQFVADKKYIPYAQERGLPRKQLAVLTCMDTRLVELLPAALDLHNGDAKIIKNAGGCVLHPCGSVMRSLLVAVHALGVRDIMVVGHTDCGMEKLDVPALSEKMKSVGVCPDSDVGTWLCGFEDGTDSVSKSVDIIKTHSLMPDYVSVRGFIMDINTGALSEIN